jgi:CRISPR-associated endonuclease/helicase Cas3
VDANILLAHIDSDGKPHHLEDHLQAVAKLSAESASTFQGQDWARLAGIWHDLGKYRAGFQQYIRQANDVNAHIEDRVGGRDKTHSAAGALWAKQYLTEAMGKNGEVAAQILSYLIAGHHAGLDNWFDGLKVRLASADTEREFSDALQALPPTEILKPLLPLPSLASIPVDGKNNKPPGAFALWVRLLFSSLVDADFLDTEDFLNPQKAVARAGFPPMEELLTAFNTYMKRKQQDIQVLGLADTAVNNLRAQVLEQCRDKAKKPSGVFTLTVPTGGGKTLSSLAFALTHAAIQKKRRVIYAIPYTSIIEQTADIFRDIFDDTNIVEHHSNVESDEKAETQRSRLACENWDAPLIVTTNVQLFESLFARKTSRCRKLHNLVNSVIVLDEAQLLPVEFLQPILDVLALLVRDYGVTLVLCTATQPSLTNRSSFDPNSQMRGFNPAEVTEIIDDVPALYAGLKRVHVQRPSNLDAKQKWEEIAAEVSQHNQVLVIVNRRKDAAHLYHLLRKESREGLYHLSALMCAEHRSATIASIKQALARNRNGGNERVCVISTQLVEAGVDLDFPVVFRAMAGLDSIAQAAGRCNREGRLELGTVRVFIPPTKPPPGLLRQAESECRVIWKELATDADPIGIELYAPYFRRLYTRDLDEKEICAALKVGNSADVRFRDAAEAFKLIDDKDGAFVLVRYKSAKKPASATSNVTEENGRGDIAPLLGLLKKEGPQRWLMRKLQRYGVTIYQHDATQLLAQSDIRLVDGCPGLYVQENDLLYDQTLGLIVDGAPGDPRDLVL